MKIVINKCYGGFGLSPIAFKKWAERKGKTIYFFVADEADINKMVPIDIQSIEGKTYYAFDSPDMPERATEYNDFYAKHHVYDHDINREDTDLVAVVEELGEKASGHYAKLSVVEVPDGVDYKIEEYDGIEWIAEKHRTWG